MGNSGDLICLVRIELQSTLRKLVKDDLLAEIYSLNSEKKKLCETQYKQAGQPLESVNLSEGKQVSRMLQELASLTTQML